MVRAWKFSITKWIEKKLQTRKAWDDTVQVKNFQLNLALKLFSRHNHLRLDFSTEAERSFAISGFHPTLLVFG